MHAEPDHDPAELAEAVQQLLDRLEDIRAQRLTPMHPSVTEAMLNARVALDPY